MIEKFGIKVSNGQGDYPGSGPISNPGYEEEVRLLNICFDNINNDKPLMVELGSYWAVWSLLFRKRFNESINILIELFKEKLNVGLKNFNLNDISENLHAFHGGVSIKSSNSRNRDKSDQGLEVDLYEVLNDINRSNIDLLHCDIQGSELDFLKSYDNMFETHQIKNVIIHTHGHLVENKNIHNDVISFLENMNYEIVHNIPNSRDDGYVYAKVK